MAYYERLVMKRISVAKFGGSSMGSATAMNRAAQIVAGTKPSLVVVSAVSGITNLLENIMKGKDPSEIISTIKTKHLDLCAALKINPPELTLGLLKQLDNFDFKATFTPERCDALYSFGERLSSSIFFELLGQAKLVDARKLIITDDTHTQAIVDYKATAQAANSEFGTLIGKTTVLTQGFIASNKKGKTTTLGRGGSDFSAAILAEAVKAEELTIWTDTAGIFSADPRIVENAHVIPRLTYEETTEYAYAGARIIHPSTLMPVERNRIALRIKNTFEPNSPGTIVENSNKTKLSINGVVAKKNQVLITLSTPQMSEPYGYLAKLFGLFAKHSISVDQVITSETAVSISMKSKMHGHSELLSDLQNLGDLKIDKNIAIVSVVGNNITRHSSAARRIIDAVGDISLRGLNQGASANVFCLLVEDQEADECVRRLHDRVII